MRGEEKAWNEYSFLHFKPSMEKQKRIAVLQATENWTGGAGNKARSHDTNNHYDQELMVIMNLFL